MLNKLWYYGQRPLLVIATAYLILQAVFAWSAVTNIDTEGHEIFLALHEQQAMPMPTVYPIYHVGFDPEMPAACNIHHAGCYYRGHIWLNATLMLSERDRKAALVHENVHHLQWLKHGEAKNCMQNLDNENAAYKATQIYLSENYHVYVSWIMPYCPPGAKL